MTIPGVGIVTALTFRHTIDDLSRANAKKGNAAYFTMMTARPQTVGYGATDSPAGLAAWILVHPGFAQWTYGADPGNRRQKTMCWTTSRCTG